MYNDIQAIMNEVFPESAQPIQAQMKEFYLNTLRTDDADLRF